MFRKSRKSVVASPTAVSEPQSRRFFKADGAEEVANEQGATFSVGATQAKPKSPGFLSRLFKRSKEDMKPVANEAQPRRKSLWQRSKSILRPRSVLDRSESAVLDLPTTQLNIRGSGSSAQLLMNEFPVEEFYAEGSAVDTDGLLMRIFEANQVMYEQLKEQERKKDADRAVGLTEVILEDQANLEHVNLEVQVKLEEQVNLEGLITPVLTATELEQCDEGVKVDAEGNFAVDSEVTVLTVASKDFYNITDHHHHFSDNLQLDSPLYREMSESFSETSDKEDSLSLESSVRSFIDGNFSREGVDSLSLTEIADMFDCLKVTEPETLKDGTVRCVFENENGSVESIRFHNWKQEEEAAVLRATRSEETLKLTEIGVAPEKQKNQKDQKEKSLVKQRSVSLATFGKVGGSQEVPVDRRRSLGAKVSQIVAMFEGAHF